MIRIERDEPTNRARKKRPKEQPMEPVSEIQFAELHRNYDVCSVAQLDRPFWT